MQRSGRRASARGEVADPNLATKEPCKTLVTTVESGFHVVVVPPDSPPVTSELIKKLDAEQDLYKVSMPLASNTPRTVVNIIPVIGR